MIRWGTSQGCSLSHLLYAIYKKPLDITIRQADTVKGIHFRNTEHKISLYTDNVIFILLDPVNAVPAVIMIIQQFGKAS